MNKALLQELLQLTPAERIEIAQELWDSIPLRDQPPLTPEQVAEVERRIDEHERNPSSAIPWGDVQTWLWSRRK